MKKLPGHPFAGVFDLQGHALVEKLEPHTEWGHQREELVHY